MDRWKPSHGEIVYSLLCFFIVFRDSNLKCWKDLVSFSYFLQYINMVKWWYLYHITCRLKQNCYFIKLLFLLPFSLSSGHQPFYSLIFGGDRLSWSHFSLSELENHWVTLLLNLKEWWMSFGLKRGAFLKEIKISTY